MKSVNIDLFPILKNNTLMRLIFLLLSFLSIPIYSQGSYSIKKTLNSTTFKYFKDQDGDYIIDYNTSTGREQKIIVRGNTNPFHGVEVREIISVAAIYKDEPVPDKLTKYLLIDNYSLKYLGNWAIFKKEDTYTIIFIVKAPFNVDKEYLEAAIIETAEAADALEKALEDEIEKSNN